MNDTLGLAEEEYSRILKHKEMADKIEFMTNAPQGLLTKLSWRLNWLAQFVMRVLFFSAFVMLDFPRSGKMKGMCEIVSGRSEMNYSR